MGQSQNEKGELPSYTKCTRDRVRDWGLGGQIGMEEHECWVQYNSGITKQICLSFPKKKTNMLNESAIYGDKLNCYLLTTLILLKMSKVYLDRSFHDRREI